MDSLDVVLEVGAKRSFACALWFPGWFAHGRTPEAAIERLLSYRPRYASIVSAIDDDLPDDDAVVVVERLAGDTTTDFGAPGAVATAEWDMTEVELERLRALHDACRTAFDQVAARASENLRKGPRGGGRDTSKVIEHVAGAEKAYASKLRREVWPEAYYLRRSAYHYTDHIWEIEDRTET